MTAHRRIVLVTAGSLGDLHPFIAVALALRARGLEPLLATFEEYRPKVEAEGLRFAPVRPSIAAVERDQGEDLATITGRLAAHPHRLYRRLVFPYLRDSYTDVLAMTTDADVVVTSSVAIGARLAAERRAIPWIAAVLQPMMFLSAFDPPILMPGTRLSQLVRRLGPGAARLALAGLRGVAAGLGGPVAALRAELGLPPSRRDPVFAGQFCAGGALGLYSPLLGAPQADHPPGTTLTGFAYYDSERGGESPLAPELEAFLATGAPPLVFTLGSVAVLSPARFFRDSLAAAMQLGRRAVLVIGDHPPAHVVGPLPPGVFACRYAPYSRLFPRAAAIVHQGGIGTLAQALRAGRPQLIVPFYADQADNAARAARLGLARTLTRARYAPASAAANLAALLDRPQYAARAAALRAALAGEQGAHAAAAVLAAAAAAPRGRA